MNGQIDQLKGILTGFSKQVDVLQKVSSSANSHLDNEHMKKVAPMANDLKKAIKSATKGDGTELDKFLKDYANSNK
jgi:hypothetical protein